MVMVRGKRRKLVVVLCLLGIVLLTAGAAYWLLFARSVPPLPKEIVAQASFPVYFPKELPEGYNISPKDVVNTDGVLFYTLKTEDNKHSITVSLQAVPKDFDPTRALGEKTVPTTITSNGTLYDFSKGKATKYLLNTGNALVYITTASNVEAKEIMTIVNSLNVIKP